MFMVTPSANKPWVHAICGLAVAGGPPPGTAGARRSSHPRRRHRGGPMFARPRSILRSHPGRAAAVGGFVLLAAGAVVAAVGGGAAPDERGPNSVGSQGVPAVGGVR